MMIDTDEQPRDGFDCPECLARHRVNDLICPECHEPVQHEAPHVWTAAWGPPPAYSHLDGQPLCPVMDKAGYRPADPVTYQRVTS